MGFEMLVVEMLLLMLVVAGEEIPHVDQQMVVRLLVAGQDQSEYQLIYRYYRI